MTKYAVVVQCKEAKAVSGTTMCEEGTEVIIEKGEWGDTSYPITSSRGIVAGVKTFDSYEAAEKFAKKWDGHPWYYTPNGQYRIVELEKQYKQVFVGYKIKD